MAKKKNNNNINEQIKKIIKLKQKLRELTLEQEKVSQEIDQIDQILSDDYLDDTVSFIEDEDEIMIKIDATMEISELPQYINDLQTLLLGKRND